jgi:hypothetical protein
MKDWRNAISDEDPEPDEFPEETDIERFRQFVHHVVPDVADGGEDPEEDEGEFLNATSTYADADVRRTNELASSGVAWNSSGPTGVDDANQDNASIQWRREVGASHAFDDEGAPVVFHEDFRSQAEYDSTD